MNKFVIILIMFLVSIVHADWLGTFDIDEYLDVAITTHRFTSGAAYTSADVQFRVYESVAGSWDINETVVATNMTEDFDGLTGLHVGSIQLTSGNTFAVSRSYVVVYTATVDSVAAIATDRFRIRAAPIAPSGEYDTQLDANMSTRAPASEYDTEMARITANVATETKQDTAQTELNKIGTIPALDGGAQTIGAAIAKLADDNAGATFDATIHSLWGLYTTGQAGWTTGGGTGLTALASGTAQAGAGNSEIRLADASSFANDFLNGAAVKILTGTGAGQHRVIVDYALTNDIATVDRDWITNPDATSTYEVVNGTVDVVTIERSDATDVLDTALATYDGPTNAEMEARTVSATAAVNLEKMYDGTGYNDDNAPSTQLQISTLAGGIAVSTIVTGITIADPGGGEQTLTYAATVTHDGIYHEVASDASGNDIDFYYTFNTGGGDNLPVDFHFHGYYEDNNAPASSTMVIQSYNFNIAAWETIATLTDSANDIGLDLPLHVHDVDPGGGGEGDVRIRFNLTTPEVSQNVRINHATVGYVSGGLTIAAIADGIWDEVIVSAHDTSNTAGALLDSPGDWTTATGFAVASDVTTAHSTTDALINGIDDNPWDAGTRTLTASTNFNDVSTSDLDTALSDIKLDHLINIAVDTNLQTTVHDDSVIGYILAKANVSNYDRTADSQEALGDVIAAIKILWDSLTITGGYLETDMINLDGTAVKSTNGNIHAVPGNI